MSENKVQILIIEDEAILAMYVSDLLETQGYEVAGVADNGPEALSLYRQNRIDLILCDINLKGDWDGIETIRYILDFKPVPVIYLTSQTDKETIERAKETFPAAYLAKPVRPDNLQISVDLAIHNYVMNRLPSAAGKETKSGTAEKEASSRESILRSGDQVFIKHNYQFVGISLNDILLLEADNTYTTIQTKGHKYTLRLSMSSLLERLDYSSLVRVHRSYAVNVNQLKGFNEREIFIDTMTIPFGQQYKEDFMRHFQAR
ncbi:response regulator [Runella sp.]|uniref:response regulator n=1 Tax=Runella sp. TaxID=1960881 RepID=UPI003D0B2111